MAWVLAHIHTMLQYLTPRTGKQRFFCSGQVLRGVLLQSILGRTWDGIQWKKLMIGSNRRGMSFMGFDGSPRPEGRYT